MFKDQTIRKRVMAVVEARITRAQEAYDSECQTIDAKVADEIEKIHIQRDRDVDNLADRLVNQVFGK